MHCLIAALLPPHAPHISAHAATASMRTALPLHAAMCQSATAGCIACMHGARQVVGSAIAISLLTYNAVPLWAGVLLTAVASFLLLLLEQFGVRRLEALFAALIGTMAVSFGVMYVLAGVPTAAVAEGARTPSTLCASTPA